MSEAQTPAAEEAAHRSFKRRLIGFVASDKMMKGVVVEVVRYKMDSMYKKYVKIRKRYKAHDEKDHYRTGDRVEIVEHRPLSKGKRWKVIKLIERPARD